MKWQWSVVKFFALLFLLPGLAGLVGGASLSTHYFDTMPRTPDPDAMRLVPRTLNGDVVYLTAREAQELYLLRHYGVRAFGIGILFGLIYLGGMATHLEQSCDSEHASEEL